MSADPHINIRCYLIYSGNKQEYFRSSPPENVSQKVVIGGVAPSRSAASAVLRDFSGLKVFVEFLLI